MMHILYVEDDTDSRSVMNMFVRKNMNHAMVTLLPDSENFEQALRNLNPPPTLCLLDIHVEPHDGFEMLQIVRAYGPLKDVPCVALTASVMNDEIAKLRSAGFDGVISKPIDTETMPTMLERILNGEKVWNVTI